MAVLGWRLTPHVVTGNWWIDQTWNGARGWRFVALQFTGLVMPGSAFLNTAHWSLIVELRISPIFPAVIWIARRIRFRQTLALTFVGSFLTANPQQTTYFGLLLFLNGSALAVHREQVAAVWRGLSRAAKILLLVVACARIATPMRFP